MDADIGGLTALAPPMAALVLPMGTAASALNHLARTVWRRAEREVVALTHEEPMNSVVPTYLNRLSDWLFALARATDSTLCLGREFTAQDEPRQPRSTRTKNRCWNRRPGGNRPGHRFQGGLFRSGFPLGQVDPVEVLAHPGLVVLAAHGLEQVGHVLVEAGRVPGEALLVLAQELDELLLAQFLV